MTPRGAAGPPVPSMLRERGPTEIQVGNWICKKNGQPAQIADLFAGPRGGRRVFLGDGSELLLAAGDTLPVFTPL